MKSSLSKVRNVMAAAALVCGVVAAASPATAQVQSAGYPAPHGIYAPFTNCPLRNPRMDLSVGGSATGCISSVSTSGTFTIHGIPVPVTHAVTVQFGVYSPPGATPSQFSGGVVDAARGKELVASPEPTPGGLLALLCPSDDPAVADICLQATATGQTQLFALIQSAGPITNFNLTTFTQPVKIKLINPLLGKNCYIGSNSNPVVLNPTITDGTLGFTPDPDPNRFPNIAVLAIKDNTVTDDTFTVPGATGCGRRGVANAAIDNRLGLPSASGLNHLELHGNSYFADDFAPAHQADDLLAAFEVSHSK